MKKRKRVLSFLPVGLLAAAVLFMTAVNGLDHGQKEQNRLQLERSLRLAAVACYAAEGAYPPGPGYLQEHYGVQINEERYAVFYEIFAENMMPEITVVELT